MELLRESEVSVGSPVAPRAGFSRFGGSQTSPRANSSHLLPTSDFSRGQLCVFPKTEATPRSSCYKSFNE